MMGLNYPARAAGRFFRVTAGLSHILISLLVCGLSLIEIIDPVGTKMADDNDPFGPPVNRLYSFSVLGVTVGVGVAGIYLICACAKRQLENEG